MSSRSPIDPEMTILDVVSRHRKTEAVFKKYDEQAGVCLCCEALFEPLYRVADRYGLDLQKLLNDLGEVATNSPKPLS
ncbi:MAG: hypothetical protein JRH08_02010 [Deltaproteobacteria bacterium]|nr:hypothetical protein [Deltaproteobacteria bacterium]MBW1928295.1 hypothetical protein [Deltaproteobacteria bacterium]MBW2025033.1 hypothetical protein [Deltaproteobacteria bacterium]MBW2124474.1 hypothetical protein [Deltaproteobacteria bacterium]RLB21850.1 MAG: hypothetical protein DRG76_08080 [Deltaproteobacteria bacterium]